MQEKLKNNLCAKRKKKKYKNKLTLGKHAIRDKYGLTKKNIAEGYDAAKKPKKKKKKNRHNLEADTVLKQTKKKKK